MYNNSFDNTVFNIFAVHSKVFGCRGIRLFSFLFAGVGVFAFAMFTVLSNGKTSAFISFSRTFLFILIGIVIMKKLWGMDGLWLIIPFSEFVTSLMVVFIIFSPKRT